MFGPDDGASDALVPFVITKMFERSKELTALDYEVRKILGKKFQSF